MKKITYLIFGKRADGQPLQQPTLRTVHPTNRPSENEWLQEFKAGSRYGHRGSFYEHNPNVVKLVSA
jgi:hypothetical protein